MKRMEWLLRLKKLMGVSRARAMKQSDNQYDCRRASLPGQHTGSFHVSGSWRPKMRKWTYMQRESGLSCNSFRDGRAGKIVVRVTSICRFLVHELKWGNSIATKRTFLLGATHFWPILALEIKQWRKQWQVFLQ